MLKVDFREVMAHHEDHLLIFEVGSTIITSTLQIRKLRLREDKQLLQIHSIKGATIQMVCLAPETAP